MVSSRDKEIGLIAYLNDRWCNCTRCPLGITANKHVILEILDSSNEKVVFNKDKIDLMFIGEAPGAGEDALGRPFIGRSGKLLRHAIAQANIYNRPYILTNTLACRPPDNRDPLPNELIACKPRLQQIV